MNSVTNSNIMTKKRGSNYTELEKEMLLEIIKRYKTIIENKECNAAFLKQKKNTWIKISEEYNSRSITGPRNWIQLRHLYDNLKQKFKKKECNTRPLSIKSEKDTIEVEEDNFEEDFENHTMTSPGDAVTYTDHNETEHQQGPLIDLKTENGFIEMSIQRNYMPLLKDITDRHERIENHAIQRTGVKRREIKKSDLNALKQKYFNMKMQNAKLERQLLIERNKRESSIHKLRMEILKTKLNIARKKK